MEHNGVVLRLAVESHMGRVYYDDFEDVEEMSLAVSSLQAEAMIETAKDGIERMVGFVVSKKDFSAENN